MLHGNSQLETDQKRYFYNKLGIALDDRPGVNTSLLVTGDWNLALVPRMRTRATGAEMGIMKQPAQQLGD